MTINRYGKTSIISSELMDERIEDEFLGYARSQVQDMVRRFQSQALRHLLNDEPNAAGDIVANLLIELDIATTVCVELLQSWGVSDTQLSVVRDEADRLHAERNPYQLSD